MIEWIWEETQDILALKSSGPSLQIYPIFLLWQFRELGLIPWQVDWLLKRMKLNTDFRSSPN